MHLVYNDAHLKYTDIVYTKRINEVYAVAHTIVLQPLLHSESVVGSNPTRAALFFLFGEKRVVWVSCLPLFSIYRKEFSC